MDPKLKKILTLTVIVKLSVLGIIYLCICYMYFNRGEFYQHMRYPLQPDITAGTFFSTWDAQHYLFLADKGYAPGVESDAFYPLFPFVVHWLGILFVGNNLVAGLVFNNLLPLFSIRFLYLLTRKKYGQGTAFNTCLILLAFPAAFYTGLFYSESIFLFLVTAFFYYYGEGKRAPTLACAFLLPLARPQGILILVPVLVDLYLQRTSKKGNELPPRLMTLAAALAGFLAYLVIMKIYTGDPFEGMREQVHFASGWSLQNLLHPWDWFVRNFVENDPVKNGVSIGTPLNRICFVGFLALLAFSWKKVTPGFFFYVLAMGLLPLLSRNLESYIRYCSVMFPLFIVLAVMLKEKLEYYLFPSLFLQAILLMMHCCNYWVA